LKTCTASGMSSAGSSSSTLFNRRTRTFTPVSLIDET
jgi:hypothetical protein